jgi:geranylgeranyl pyrophosphate synthase
MTEVVLHCHFGQALDLAGDLAQIPQRGVGRVVKSAAGLKTARLMGLAAELGVAAAGADAGRFRVARGVGRNVGVGLQILNDLCDLAGEDDECKRFEDLRAGKPTWPWAVLAKSLSTAEYRRFLDELEAVRKGEAPPCGLARRLLTQTEDGCRRLAARAFRRAEADLDRTYGNVPAVHALIDEIARLERRYAQ